MAETPTMEVRARLTAETAQFTKGMQQATQSMSSFTEQSSRLRGAVLGVGIAAGAATAAIIAFGTKSFMAAARVDELDVAMNAVGKASGLGYQAIRDAAVATKDMGIEMEVAQQSAIKFAQNNLKLSYASELARAAQDLAVVSGKNSTDTFNMLTHAVITGRSEVLKSVGIQKSAGQMYESFARSLGISASALTYQQKQQAVATGALKEAAKVAGVYEAAMDSPGKVLRSFARIHNEIQVSVGGVLLKAFGPMIKSLYDLEKNISKAFTGSQKFKDILEALQMVFVKLTAPITAFVTKLSDAIKKFTEASAPVKNLDGTLTDSKASVIAIAEKFEMLLPVLASVGAAFGVMGGKQIFAMVPILGRVMQSLSPLPVAFLVLALTSTQVRNAFLNLISAFKPVLPIFVQLGKIMGAVSVIAVALLAKAINLVAGAVRGVIGFVQTNIGLFKNLAIAVGILAIGYGAYRATILLTTAATWLWGAATTAVTVVTNTLRVAVAMLNATMALNPIPLIIGAVIALMVAFGYLIKTNKDVAKVVGVVFNFIIKTVIYVLAYIVKTIGYLLKAFAMWIRVLGFVAEVIAKVFEFIIDVVLTYFQFQLKVIKYIVDAFINLMESHGVLYDVVKFIFNAIIKVISLVVEGIVRVLAFVIGVIADVIGAFNDLFGAGKSIFLSILGVISKVGGGIFSVLENIASNIGKFLGFVYDKLTAFIRGLADLIEKLPKIGPELAAGIRSGLDAGRSLVTGFASTLVGFGKTAFDGIVSGVEFAVNKIGGIGAGVEKGLRATEKTLTKFAVKVQEFGNKDNGAKILETLVAGAKMASSALEKMIDVIQDVKDFDFARTVGSFIDGMAEKADKAGEFLIGLSASMMEFADKTDFASEVGEGIGDFINKIKDSLKEGLGFGDILAEEKKKYNEASNTGADADKAAEDALKAADRMKSIREAMQAGIDSIKGVLDDLRKASGEFADSLKDTILGFAGLKSIELPDGFIPKAKSLIENMRQRLDKSNQFAQQIATLQAMGLDSGALKDIIESGPVKGAQLAASILGGGAEAISQINSLQKAISFSGAAIGQYGADAAFGGLISNAQAQLNRVTEAELATRTSGNNQFIQQGAFQVVINTSGAKTDEEELKMITDKIEQTFAILAKELAAK
jgi:phage-related protein